MAPSANLCFSADEVITSIYRGVLDRAPDEEGKYNHLRHLTQGMPLADLVREFISSPEFQSRFGSTTPKTIIPQTSLPNLKEMYPDSFEDNFYLATSSNNINLMESLITEHWYYDSFGVWGSVIDFDKLTMAYLVQCMGATSCLEVGCFNGPVLSVLCDRGVEVTGVDASHLAFMIAFPNIRNRLVYGDLLDVRFCKQFDCILLLDIMEHLNPLKIHLYIEKLYNLLNPNGIIIMNSPMFGDDPIFGTVFQQDLRQWQEIGDRDFFKHWPCDAMGWPMHGHMVWASPKWWTQQLNNFGLIRQTRVEKYIQDTFRDYFEKAPARRSLFVLSRREAAINENQICHSIAQQCWSISG